MDPIVGLVVAGVLIAAVVYRRRPLSPEVPRWWRSSHSYAPTLCRRVHRAVDRAERAVRQAHRKGVAVTTYDTALDDLRTCATAIDRRLVVAAELPLRPRYRALHELRARVAEVEKAATRVATMAIDAGRPDVDHVPTLVDGVHARLDDLEQARRDLRAYGGA